MTDLSKHVILAVDDEQDNLEVFRATLELMYGAKVHTALDGQEALRRLDSVQPTLIITDLSMPKMDGYALLHQLRKHANTAMLPVIALTAHVMRGDRERILEAGFDGYLSKPFDIVTLGEEIEEWLRAFSLKTANVQRTIQAEVQKLNIEVLNTGENNAIR